MFCSQCGTNLVSDAKFCSNCGLPTSRVMQPECAMNTRGGHVTNSARLGTKWLKFWNYFSLPVGGILGLLVSLRFPDVGIIIGSISILQLAVAYGLHNRRLWAWQWNWVVIVLTWFSGAIPRAFGNSMDFWVKFVLFVVVFGFIWIWPNYVYWNKRKHLFKPKPTPQSHVY